jgi:ABC-2 type transport system permease protein
VKKLSDIHLQGKKSKINILVTQIRRSFIITKKDLRIYYNKPPVLIQGVLFPIILFIALTLGRNVQSIYLISGMMAMIIFLTSTSIGPIVFPWESMRKTFERLITCPISIKTILLGSMWSSFIYGIMFSTIPLILGSIFLANPLNINLLIIIMGMIVAGLAFACFSLILSAPPSSTPGSTMILTILIKFPLIFMTPLFMPINLTPVAYVSPLTYFIDIINVGLGDSSVFGSLGVLVDLLVLLGMAFFFLFLAFVLHGKTLEKRFRG